MNNKQVLNHCPNFYKISNFECTEDDYVTKKLINIYKTFIFSVDMSEFENVKKIEELDTILSKYIDDYYFRKEMKTSLMNLRVKTGDNVLLVIVDSIIKIFKKYEDDYTRNIYISRWI